MKGNSFIACLLIMSLVTSNLFGQITGKPQGEQYRLQAHFSPKAHWVNDPNGMVYNNGIYHLFFQYHPYSSTWGPMHWGHATSKDMIHWKHEPIAIYPDSNGTIFSGSAVVDKNNTTGFGKKGQAPMVAIFTHHNSIGEKAGRNDFQNQSIAYSNDNGKTWIKYSGNPVLKNPGITDFRDPKVMWYEPQKKWVMTLATKDCISFFSSPNLKDWQKESEFGKTLGAHGGVWECPDLISLDDNGKQRWVLIVNLNPGGPNMGSATQYFVGDFNGKTFVTDQQDTRWLDFGPDNYAGVTWSNTGKRKILIGWMSNWMYANQVPTEAWRNAMTLPRELKLQHVGNSIFVAAQPVAELASIQSKPVAVQNISVNKIIDISKLTGKIGFPCKLDITANQLKDFSIVLSNSIGEELLIGYDSKLQQYFIDRTKAGKSDFNKDFAKRHFAPRLTDEKKMKISLVIDVSSIELFADDGLTVMTSIFFPNKPYTAMQIKSQDSLSIKKLLYSKLSSILK
jgi:fructan beta-fructosidase